jgi:sugar phosphate isomerase/epimerase
MAHAKDRAADGRFVTVGSGIIDLPDLIAQLRGAGFDGPVVTHGLDAAEAPAVARYLCEITA